MRIAIVVSFVLFVPVALAATQERNMKADLEELSKLNDNYIHSVQYSDVWARRNGKWLAVSAHVTRK